MKRYVHANEAFNYSDYIIEAQEDGWHIYNAWNKEHVKGPFRSWVDAEEYIDEME